MARVHTFLLESTQALLRTAKLKEEGLSARTALLV